MKNYQFTLTYFFSKLQQKPNSLEAMPNSGQKVCHYKMLIFLSLC